MSGMYLKQIDMTLDPESIQNAIDIIENTADNLKLALDEFCKYLLKEGKMIAKIQLRTFYDSDMRGMRTGHLSGSIDIETESGESGGGYIVAGSPGDSNGEYSYAVYFEFGFGTGSYYRHNGSLIKSSNSVDMHRQAGMIANQSGRLKDHPSQRDVYRDMEDFNTIKQNDGTEFYGWVYKDKRSGKFFVSHGQNPKPFMYNTYLLLGEKIAEEGPRFIAEYIA